MSDTPRTDKAETSALWMINFRRVTAEFARELERENAALRERIEMLSKPNTKQTDEYICVDREHGLWKRKEAQP